LPEECSVTAYKEPLHSHLLTSHPPQVYFPECKDGDC